MRHTYDCRSIRLNEIAMTHYVQTIPGWILATFLLPSLANAESGPFLGAGFGSSHLDKDIRGLNIDTDVNAYRLVGGAPVAWIAALCITMHSSFRLV